MTIAKDIADVADSLAPVRAGLVGSGRRTRHRSALDPLTLLDLAKQSAERVEPWPKPNGPPQTDRVYELVELTDDFEVLVIHWPRGGHLHLHDHGGSAGALWVVSGLLEERYQSPDGWDGRLGSRLHVAPSGVGFDASYVHDVRNGGPLPATSVHAYSPPMPAMTYYRETPWGLAADRTEYRSDPAWAP